MGQNGNQQPTRPQRGGGSYAPTTRHPGALPLCKDCTHFRSGAAGSPDVCTHPDHGFDLVRGEPYNRLCLQERSDEREPPFTACGRMGRGFEERAEVAA